MIFIIIFKPKRQLLHDRNRTQQMIHVHIIPLEGFDEGLCHTIRLRTMIGSRAELKADRRGKGSGFIGDITGSIIAEPLDGLRQLIDKSEPVSPYASEEEDY